MLFLSPWTFRILTLLALAIHLFYFLVKIMNPREINNHSSLLIGWEGSGCGTWGHRGVGEAGRLLPPYGFLGLDLRIKMTSDGSRGQKYTDLFNKSFTPHKNLPKEWSPIDMAKMNGFYISDWTKKGSPWKVMKLCGETKRKVIIILTKSPCVVFS